MAAECPRAQKHDGIARDDAGPLKESEVPALVGGGLQNKHSGVEACCGERQSVSVPTIIQKGDAI